MGSPNDELWERIHWHSLQIEEVYEKLCTSSAGLPEQEAEQRLIQYGKNELPLKKPPGTVVLFLRQFKSPLIYILIIAATISFLLGDIKDGIFILLVVILNSGIGLVQEWKAEQSAGKLQRLFQIQARVHRGKPIQKIDAAYLVPGDVISIESGDRIPADIRLIHIAHLSIDESVLTGESVLQEKSLSVIPAGTPLALRTNMAFGGTIVSSGRGIGVVTATGTGSEVGFIAQTVAATEAAKPPLLVRMEKFSLQIGILVVAASILMAGVALLHGTPLTEVFFLAVALAVSAIPEGLPVAITVALSIGASRMAQRNVIVRRLSAVESLGSCTMIATDKTGTLTVNQQTVTRVMFPTGESITVSGAGYAGIGTVSYEDHGQLSPEIQSLVRNIAIAGTICNDGSLYPEGEQWISNGDTMDVALLAFAYKTGIEPDRVRSDIRILHEVPFEPERMYQAVYYSGSLNGTESPRIAVKGALEALLPFCTTIRSAEGEIACAPEKIKSLQSKLTGQGFRVLAIAVGELSGLPPEPLELEMVRPSLTLLGLAGFIDPVRPDVPGAVMRAKESGVNVVMITGDHPGTAFSVARDLHIAEYESQVITGVELAAIGSPDLPEFNSIVAGSSVFARVTPIQKLEIVNAMIRNGHFVAVTGDGVNDAPALSRANIGVAMGSGSDVAKDTSSMIITDDNFSSIVAGIEEGRYSYDNIRKVTYLLISTGFAEIILFILALIAGFPLPLLAIQLLWLNLVTNGIQDVALAFEQGEPETMLKPPRNPDEGVFNSLMVQQTLVSGAVIGLLAFSTWYWLLQTGWEESAARNMVVLLMVLLENFHALNCRSEYRSLFKIPIKNNYFLIIGIILAQCVQILAMNIPATAEVLRLSPVSFQDWTILLIIASVIIGVMELFKWHTRSGKAAQVDLNLKSVK